MSEVGQCTIGGKHRRTGLFSHFVVCITHVLVLVSGYFPGFSQPPAPKIIMASELQSMQICRNWAYVTSNIRRTCRHPLPPSPSLALEFWVPCRITSCTLPKSNLLTHVLNVFRGWRFHAESGVRGPCSWTASLQLLPLQPNPADNLQGRWVRIRPLVGPRLRTACTGNQGFRLVLQVWPLSLDIESARDI